MRAESTIRMAKCSERTFGSALGGFRPSAAPPSCHLRQVPHSDQIVGCRGEDKHPTDPRHSLMPGLAHQPDCLQPAEDLFHTLTDSLADGVPRMTRRPAIDRTLAPRNVLRHMRGDHKVPGLCYKVAGVVALVRTHRDPSRARNLRQHFQRGLALRGPCRLRQLSIDHQAMAIFHQDMTHVGQLRFSPWKSTVGLPGSSGAGSSPARSFCWKLFWLAQASIKLPSTVKCSVDSRWSFSACASTRAKNSLAMSPSSSRSRFLLNTVGTHTASSIPSPTNQRNSRL